MNVMRTLSKERLQKIVLIGIMAMVGVSATWIFYGNKQLVALKEGRTEVVKLKEDVAAAKQSAQITMRTAPLRGKMQAFVDEQRATMVSGDPFAWVVREMAMLAGSQPVRDVTPRIGNIVPHPRKDRFEWYVTRLEFSGSYRQIGAFVEELENKFPEAEIRMLDIAGSEDTEGHRASLDLALLVRPEFEWEKTAAKSTVESKAKP